MTKREKHALVLLLSIVGILAVGLLDVTLLPPAYQRLSHVRQLRSQVSSKAAEESQATKMSSEVQEELAGFKQDLDQIEKDLVKYRFEPKMEGEIAAFIKDIQKIFAGTGLKLEQIAYQSKTRENGFVTFPFDCSVEASYYGFRKLLETIQTHPTGIHVDRLEFLRLDNEHHLMHIRIRCSARFREKA